MKTKINREELLAVLTAAEAGLSRSGRIEQSTCFTADTVIHTLGGDFTVKQLLSMDRTDFKVFSAKNGKLKIGDAHSLRKTKSMAKVYLVKFDTGDQIKLTADHLVMLRDGSYKRVDTLRDGESVMPFNYYYRSDGYRMVYRRLTKKPVRAYRWVFEQTHGYTPKRPNHAHHKDHNTRNDDPDNLQELTAAEHLRTHLIEMGDDHPMKADYHRERQSKIMMGNNRSAKKKPWISKMMKGERRNAKLTWGKVRAIRKKFHRGWNHQQLAVRYGVTESNIGYILNNKTWKEEPGNNHKVVSVEFAGREDVYDLSVDKYHNFAANGVFIHNCFCFRRGKVRTFNEEVSVSARSGLPKEFTGAVQSKSLLAILKKITERKLRAVFDPAAGRVTIRANGKGVALRYAEKIILPLDACPPPAEDGWEKLPAAFGEAVSIVQECAGTDATKTAMACVHLHPNWVEATQKFQAVRYKIKLPLAAPVLVKPGGLRHVVSLDCTEVNADADWVHFRNEAGIVVSLRREDAKFPDLGEMLEMDRGKTAELPDGLESAIERAEIFSKEDQDSNHLTVAIEDGVLTVTAVGMTGKYWEDAGVKYDGDPLAFLISPKMLAEVVRRSNRVEINKEKLRVKGPNWRYVTSLTDPETALQMAEQATQALAEQADDDGGD